MRVAVTIDGLEVDLEGDADESLSTAARRAGANRIVLGCSDGRCGACRALVGENVISTCTVPLASIEQGTRIFTAASLDATAPARAALEAFTAERPTRCRMCVGALAVTAWALSRELEGGVTREEATEELVRDATCMCTGRGSWRRALAVVRRTR